jgi:large subunit ribosomal protein L22
MIDIWPCLSLGEQIRGLPVEKAIIQTTFSPKKAAIFIKEVLMDTHDRAQRVYNCTKGNLYVAESYVGRGPILKRIRYHAKGRFGTERNRYSHYFLILREGPPPKKKKREKESRKHYKTLRIINAGPRGIPNSL